jgi:hypothetical protein
MYVYIMSRPDGWHKIGMSGEPEHRRHHLVGVPTLVRQFKIGDYAATIEYFAHKEMAALGITEREGEWFNADARLCARAIRRAIRKFDKIGGYYEWTVYLKRGNVRRTGGKTGHPLTPFTREQLEKARAAWFNPDYATNRIAAKYTGMSVEMCRRRWGVSGRPFPKRKRK